MSTDTRDRIQDVARELFVEQGYEGTSLREIADRLDITKAALYYHFHSKEALLRSLLEPFDTLIDQLLDRLEAATDKEAWSNALTGIITEVFAHLDFFRLIDRNRNVVEQMLHHVHAEHTDMHRRVEVAAHRIATSLAEEVRMIAALGAVTGFDDWAPTLLKEADPAELQTEMTAAVRDLLELPPARRRARVAVSQPA
jgi:AcrR family transcriptional regulator